MSKKITMTYEQAMEELGDLVKRWEGAQGNLSKAVQDLERAAFLVAYCRNYLREVEQKVEAVVL